MHILYVDHDQYFNYHNPNSKLMPLSVAGVQELRFANLDDAARFKEENREKFIFIEGEDSRLTAYRRWEEMYERFEADSNRSKLGSSANR